MTNLRFENSFLYSGARVIEFSKSYFVERNKKCLLIAAAGFDPRSTRVAEILAKECNLNYEAIAIKERRNDDNRLQQTLAERNEKEFTSITDSLKFMDVSIFSDDDEPVGGVNVKKKIELTDTSKYDDVIIDISALSIDIWFTLLKHFLKDENIRVHIMLIADPELDEKIVGEPSERLLSVQEFEGTDKDFQLEGIERYKFWLPFLSKGNLKNIQKLKVEIEGRGDWEKICPVLPFPSLESRISDLILYEYRSIILDEWQIDPVDIIYVSETNPLNSYRILSKLAKHYKNSVKGLFNVLIELSPSGNKVMTIGAMLAAIECEISIKTFESTKFKFDSTSYKYDKYDESSKLIHLIISKGEEYQITETPEYSSSCGKGA